EHSMSSTLARTFIAVCLGSLSLVAQQTPTAAAKPVQVAAPTRDPHTEGYVKAKELPDGELPKPEQNGNFILGPTHKPADDLSPKDGVPKGQIIEFTMDSKDSKIYPGIARESGRPNVDPANPAKLLINSHPAPYTRKVAVYIPKQYVPGTEAP